VAPDVFVVLGVSNVDHADAIVGGVLHALQEERDPTLPVSVRTHGRQPRVVLGLRPPERYAEVEQRLIEQAPVLDRQPPA
jgi:hypothetical protein